MENKNFKTIGLIILTIVLFGIIFLAKKGPSNTTVGNQQGDYRYAPLDWKIWEDQYYSKETGEFFSYRLSYPRDFDVYRMGGASGGFLVPGSERVQIKFPEDAFQDKKTNFGEAYISVSESKAANAVASCFIDPQTGDAMTKKETINELNFLETDVTDAGAGNIYTSRVYRTIFQGLCYELTLTVHTSNIYNYDPGTVTEFDKNLAFPLLEKIFRTVNFNTSVNPD